MLTTSGLEAWLADRIGSVLPSADLSGIYFTIGGEGSPEGVYVFSQNGQYHYLFTEKGRIVKHKQCTNEEELLWDVLEIVAGDLAMQYAMKNRVENEDFRKKLFEREIELFSLFGDAFRQRKITEISRILRAAPYA